MRKLILAAALLLPLPAFADPLVQESAPSTISVDRQGENFRVVNDSRRYQTNILASVQAKNLLLYQLLEIEQHQVSTEGPQTEQSFEESTAKVTVYPLTEKGKGAAAFTIEGKADAVTAMGNYLTLTRYGCCVEMPTYAVYSLESGKYLFNATGEGQSGQWTTMGAQGGWAFERIFAIHARITAADDDLFGDEKNGAVILTYAKENEPLQRVMLIASADDMAHDQPLEWMPKIDLVSAAYPKGIDRIFIDRFDKPENLFTDATLRLTLDEGTVVEIPLVADKLDLKAAKLPQGYSLKEIKL
ncbi:hypothetical protein [Dongia rigui]|uniref:Uncharacterized protein n=1 Tax=Dongia rigui TaxID=940149 RepID=A0ABU5DXR4_9PROT|nr:hypothetical protein [Dongia rigui]MDY0871729.1 hypothetical protein [Dongia rigui]